MDYYLGTITQVLNPDFYHVKIDIPGLAREVEAFPIRGELDEPREGDQVLVRDVDPVYHSFYLYSEIKDDEFIGVRSRGKMIHITEDEITIGIFDPEEKYEKKADELPEITTWVKIDKKGNLEISTEKDITVNADGKVNINAQKSIEIKSESTLTIDSPSTKLTGGVLTTEGTPVVQLLSNGPYCSIPRCPITGAAHCTPRVINT